MSKEDDIASLYEQCYRGSSTINITTYFDEYKNLIDNSNISKDHEKTEEENIMKIIGDDMDKEKYDLLSEYCSIDNLTVENELPKMTKNSFEWLKDPPDRSIVDLVLLQTVQFTKQRNRLKYHQVFTKYRSEKPITYEPEEFTSEDHMLQPDSDILVYVRVYVPFTSRHKQSSGALGKLSLNYVIAMHGSQTLDKLRDQISCISDYSISREASNVPIRFHGNNAKDVYRSGFFFIENTFYNDFRDPNNKDNSKVIREWAEARKYGTYKIAKMEETRIDSLVLRFGFPWVYQHQGDCEHLISFSDARLVNQTDELKASCYPRIIRIKPRPNRYCMTCGIYSVNWVTTGNNRLPHNPCLFCDSCFKSYNYIKGKKVGSFKAYPYPCDRNLLKSNLTEHTRAKACISKVEDSESEEETCIIKSHIKKEENQMDTS